MGVYTRAATCHFVEECFLMAYANCLFAKAKIRSFESEKRVGLEVSEIKELDF